MNDSWIQTYTGKQFFPLNPDPAAICIEDIAHSLSMQCRFNGHCKRFYSVAEHSVLVSRFCRPDYALAGLLHDAAEAYLSDLPAPIKAELALYRDAENRLTAAIFEKFGLKFPIHNDVKFMDSVLLSTEKSEIMGKEPARWPQIKHPPIESIAKPVLNCWVPVVAKYEFLKRFDNLCLGGS
ncbi:MAG: phosphohydrolase [Magnetococcales bacterium]|nr:phosphohydrolase [Magnetococcales bacterium]